MSNVAPTVTISATGSMSPSGPDIAKSWALPNVTSLPNGNYVLAWRAADNAVHVQVLAPDGTAVSSETIANYNYYMADPSQIALESLSNGDFVVAWSGGRSGVNGYTLVYQRYDSSGQKIGLDTAASDPQLFYQQRDIRILPLTEGKFAITWTDWDYSSGHPPIDVEANLIGPDNQPGSVIEVNSNITGDQTTPAGAGLTNGNYVILWTDHSPAAGGAPGDTSDSAVKGQMFGPDGSRIGAEFLVNSTTFDSQFDVRAIALPSGGFVAAWTTADGSGTGFRARVFNDAGAPLGPDFLVNTSTDLSQLDIELAVLSNGNIVATWMDSDGAISTAGAAIRAQLFSPTGTPIGSEFRVNSIAAGAHGYPEIAALSGGGFVIGWRTGNDFAVQLFDAHGAPVGDQTKLNEVSVAGTTRALDLAGLTNGGFAAAWDAANSLNEAGMLHSRAYSVSSILEAKEQTLLSLKGAISVNDLDAGGGNVTVTLGVTAGRIDVDPGTSGVAVAGSGSGLATLNGTIAQLAALFGFGGPGSISYLSSGPGTAMLDVTVNDNGNTGGEPQTASASVTIESAANVPPSLYVNGTTTTFVEGKDAPSDSISIDPLLDIGDGDNATLASATVRIAGGFQPDQDQLLYYANIPSIAASYDQTTGTLQLTSANGAATVADFINALRAVKFWNPSDTPVAGTRTIEFVVNDGVADSAVRTRPVQVQPINDSPILDLNGAAAGHDATALYTSGMAPLAIAPATTVHDVDSADFASGQLLVYYTANASAEALLTFRNEGTGPGQIGVSGNQLSYGGTQIGIFSGGAGTNLAVSFNANATQPATEALIRALVYSNSGDGPSPGFQLTLSDGDGATSLAAFAAIGSKTAFSPPAQWGGIIPPQDQRWYVGDFDGDGTDDVFRVLDGISGADMFLSLGVRFTGAGSWTPAGTGSDGRWYVGDFNGDGRDDVFRWFESTQGTDLFLSDGARFVHDNDWGYAVVQPGQTYVGDFNGDGRDDVFRYASGQSGAYMFLSSGSKFRPGHSWTGAGFGSDNTWYIGDFNGDGRDDLFRYLEGTSGADVFLSNGSAFVHDGSWTGAGQGSDGRWHIGDFNGDGRDDLARYLVGQSGADVFLSTGSAFDHAGSWTGAGFGLDGWYIGDFSGDGSSDLLRVLASGTEVLI